MKQIMKIAMLTGIILSNTLFGNNLYSQYSITSNPEAFNEAVYKGIEKYIEKIPTGKESDFGFNSTDEFERMVIGEPYQICILDENSFTESFQSDTFQLINRWSVPILIENEYRCFIDIVYDGNSFKAVGFGLHELADDLGIYEKSFPHKDKKEKILFINNYLMTYCIAIKNESYLLEFYPFRKLNCDNKSDSKTYYSGNDLHQILKKKQLKK